MRTEVTKAVLDIDLNGLSALSDPYPLYDLVRIEDPVHWNESDSHWYLTRYDDVLSCLRDQRLSAAISRARADTLPAEVKQVTGPWFEAVASWMLMTDPPSHTRMRGLVNKAFTPRVVENMRTRIQTLVDGMLDKIQENGRMDVIADLAVPLPGIVISDLLGVPEKDQPQFKKWSNDLAGNLAPSGLEGQLERFTLAQKSFFELSDYFRGVVESLRGHPKENLLSALVEAEEAGDKLTEDELIANCVLLMFAGNETTTNLIGNGTLALLQNPEQERMLQDNRELIGSAVEEFLRFDSPVQKRARIALVDMELGGKAIKAGELVMMCFGAANRDPEQFVEPNRLDITRKENRHLAFSQGVHYCLGASLARLEGQIAIDTLLNRLPDIELEAGDLERNPSVTLWGLRALPVTF